MNTVLRRLMVSALGFLLLTALYACLVPDVGYVGGVYETSVYDYGGWRQGYRVGPARRGERRVMQTPPRAYRSAPQSRPAPPIPFRQRGR